MRQTPEKVLVIACGALAREILHLKKVNDWQHMDLTCISADLHNRPTLIGARLRSKITEARASYKHIFIAYAECGTQGEIDKIIADEKDVERLPGAHCYQFFAGGKRFEELAEEEPGTLYLTDFLTRNFERLIVKTLKLDVYPQLRDEFFGNYTRVVYLSQSKDPTLLASAKAAAEYLQLDFEHLHSGYGELETSLALQMSA